MCSDHDHSILRDLGLLRMLLAGLLSFACGLEQRMPIVKVDPVEPPKLLKPIVKINNLEPEPVRLQLADVLAALKNQREHWPDRSRV